MLHCDPVCCTVIQCAAELQLQFSYRIDQKMPHCGPLTTAHSSHSTQFQQTEREEKLEENIRDLEQAKSDLSIRAENAERQIKVLEENILQLESKFSFLTFSGGHTVLFLPIFQNVHTRNAACNPCAYHTVNSTSIN